MRPPQSPDGTPQPYNADLCRATRRLRTRLSQAVDRVEALEAELRAERAAMAAERAALAEHLDSPEAERDVMLIAQDLLKAEVMEAATQRALCPRCGGLGHGMTQGLLSKRVADHCQAHDLSPTRDLDAVADWPHVGGLTAGKGRWRDPTWLRDPPGQRGQRRHEAAIW